MLAASLTQPRSLVILAVTAAALVVVFRAMVRAERTGRPVLIINWIIGLLVVEGTLWAQNGTPFGPFHPQIGSQNFRLYDVIIPLALAARLRAGGLPRRIGAPAIGLAAFLCWYTVCAVVGIVDHNGVNVIYQWKLVVYLGGGYALACGVPAQQLVGPQGIIRLARPMAAGLAVVDILSFAGVSITVSSKYIAIYQLRGVMSDATTVSIAVGAVALAVELCSDDQPRSITTIAAAAVLMLSAVTSGQRAVLLELGAVVGVLAVAWLAPHRRRHVRVSSTETGLVALATSGLLLAPAVVEGKSPFSLKAIPFASKIANQTFSNLGKVESAQQRTNELHQVALLFPARPVFGWGLGQQIVYYQTGAYSYLSSAVADDVYADLLLRTGLVGVTLWAATVLPAVWGGIRAWRRALDARVAALGLASSAVVVGILAAGAGESIFEKYRIAVALGIFLGMARAAAVAEAPAATPTF